ncbi:MAG TPA: TIR domain-containing protein [Thermoanaerobaculia bacterium]|nr:TIR domain-containing protein [Thermoanaerobaculia bacterium]
MADIFISYAREERVRVEALAAVLERCGWSVWWDKHLRLGREFSPEIERELQAARCVIVLWSRSSVASKWVVIEASEGRERGILVPVLIENVSPPIEFKRLHTANLVHWNPSVRHPDLDELLAELRRMLGGDASHAADLSLPAEDHAAILRSGARAWNDWRSQNPHIAPNLAGANLAALNLSHANLASANLANANLSLSVLDHANFQNAILAGANLSEARLCDANFKEADLTRVNLRRAILENTILIGAKLAGAKNLEFTIHLDTSHIDDRVLSGSPGLARPFLRGCGLSDEEVTHYEQQSRH